MIFAQAIVFHPYFMEITSLYPSDCNLAIRVVQNCLKISVNHVFFGNFKLPLWIFQNRLNSDFYLTCIIP